MSLRKESALPVLDWPNEGRHILVGGDWIEIDSPASIDSISPIDEQKIGQIAAASASDVDRAVSLIEPALEPWASLAVADRAPYLMRLASRLRDQADELIDIEIADSGLTRRTAIRDLERSITWLSDYCAYGLGLTGQTFPSSAAALGFTTREPYGIVGRIVPFNHPLNFAVQAIAGPVIAGNVVILKPPEQCSLSTLALGSLVKECFPPGVVNIMTGYGADVGTAIVAHPKIPRIGFTGSVATGRRVLEAAADHIKHVSLELGGKNPLIVTSTADLTAAAQAAVSGMNFTHAGQSCQSTSRILIHADVYDDVVEQIAAIMSELKVGDPREIETDTGPLAYAAHYARVREYVEVAHKEHARLVVGGHRPAHLDVGYYLAPTLFADVHPTMRIAREEIFGPVLVALKWTDEDDVVRIANDTEFGLNARVFAGSLDEGYRIARRVKSGMSFVNTAAGLVAGMPFGGAKESGLGRQNCADEVLSYTEERSYVLGL